MGYLAFSVPEDQDEGNLGETETEDEDDTQAQDEEIYDGVGGDYATFDETEDEDGDYVAFNEGGQDSTDQDPPTPQDPTVSNPDFDEQNTICQDITNPFCGRTITQDFKLEPRDLGEWAGPQITVMMRLKLEGNGERTKAGLFFKKDGNAQFEGQRNLDATVRQEGGLWIVTVPLGKQHRIILNGGMVTTGLISQGMDKHGFYEEDTDGEIVQKDSLIFVYSPPQNLRFLRTKEMDFILEHLVDRHNNKIKSLVGNLPIQTTNTCGQWNNKPKSLPSFVLSDWRWGWKYDNDGFITPWSSHTRHKIGRGDARDGDKHKHKGYKWPRGFAFGGRPSKHGDDKTPREIRRDGWYEGTSSDDSAKFSAVTQGKKIWHDRDPTTPQSQYCGFGPFYHADRDGKKGAPYDIYLTFDQSDQRWWYSSGGMPRKPERQNRTLSEFVPTTTGGYEIEVGVQMPENIAVPIS